MAQCQPERSRGPTTVPALQHGPLSHWQAQQQCPPNPWKRSPVGEKAPGPTPIAVHLAEQTPAWSETFERERLRLRQALGDILIDVHHIGSTAIPNIRAKPVVDLMPIVSDLRNLDAARIAVETLGYEWWGEYGIQDRRFCTLTDTAGQRIVHAHFFAHGSSAVEGHLAFRNYLRAQPNIAKEYEAIKRRAADTSPNDSNEYSQRKSAWILATEAKALAHYRNLKSTT